MVGVASHRLGGRALTGGGARDVVSAYGVFRGLPRLAVLALFERTPAAGELVMDGIAVDAAYRGRGIGGLLLTETAALAADHGCHRIRLDVIDTNPAPGHCTNGTASPVTAPSGPPTCGT